MNTLDSSNDCYSASPNDTTRANKLRRIVKWAALLALIVLLLTCWRYFAIRRTQFSAANNLERQGSVVTYHFQATSTSRRDTRRNSTPPGPLFLRTLLGDTFFSDAHTVYCSNTHSTKDTIKYLNALNRLKALSLAATDIDDESIDSLESKASLEVVSLDSTDITDRSCASLSRFPSLRAVSLNGTTVTIEGVKSLKTLPELEFVAVHGTSLSQEDVAALGLNMPGVEVVSGPVLNTRQRKALAELERLGMWVEYHLRNKNNNNVWLHLYLPRAIGGFRHRRWVGKSRDLARMVILSKFIEKVDLSFAPGIQKAAVNDNGLAAIAKLKSLRILILTDTSITNSGLVHLRGHKRLKELILSQLNVKESQISNAAMKHISTIEHLETLNLSATRVGDRGMADLASHKALRTIDLSSTAVSDKGVEQLCEISSLQNVRLNSTKITDRGLAHLRSLEDLRQLSLSHTMISFAGMLHLTSLKKLEFVRVTGTDISKEQLNKLRQNMPWCQFEAH